MHEGHSYNKGNFLTVEQTILKGIQFEFFWLKSNQLYNEGHSINKGNFFDWSATNSMYEGHSINKGNFLTEEQPIICMRDIHK